MQVAFLYCDVGAPSRNNHLVEIGVHHQILADAKHEVRSMLFGWFESPESVLGKLAFSPEIFVFYLDEFNFLPTGAFAKALRGEFPQTKFVAIGPYTVLSPDSILHHGAFDCLLAGESESGLFEFVSVCNSPEKFCHIRNLWWRKPDGEIVRNPIRPLLDNPDTLPLPDYSLCDNDWTKYPDDCALMVRASLGCPHECTFCYLPVFSRSTAGKGEFYRSRAAASVAGEILGAIRSQSYSRVIFTDELFPTQKTWLRSFVQHLRGLELPPWEATVAVDRIDRETLQLLFEAGCRYLKIGIETGSEAFRKRLATRNLSNEAIAKLCEFSQETGIQICARVMVGLPLEDETLVRETLQFLRDLKVASIEWRFYYPVEKTPLGEYSRPKMQNLCSQSIPLPFYPTAPFGLESREQLIDLAREIALLAMAKTVRHLPPPPSHAIEGLLFYLPQAEVAFGQTGTALLQSYCGKEGRRSVLTLVPPVALAFPTIAFPESSVLQFAIAIPEKTERYLTARNAHARIEVACQTSEQKVVLLEKRFGSGQEQLSGHWREVLIPIPEEISSGKIIVLLETNAPEPAEVCVGLAEPILVQEASLVKSREAEYQLRLELQREAEKLKSKIDELEAELASLRERERQAHEEAAKKAKRVSELQIQVLELEKRCETLENELRGAKRSAGFLAHAREFFSRKR